MTALERVVAALAGAGPVSAGVAAAGWLVALLVAGLAVWQAVRADAAAVRAAEAAHELRGPLCSARLALASVQRMLPDAPGFLRGVAAVDLELGRAGLALDELADVGAGRHRGAARASAAGREPVDLAALARAAEPAWRGLAEARSTTLELRVDEPPVTVLGDPRRLLQAIENLVANACEHGRGPVRVRVAGTNAIARVEVSDQGSGPPGDVIARACRGVRRPWSLRSTTSLRGHGMVVVARAAAEAGGALRVRHAPTETVVWLELPSEGSAWPRLEPRIGHLTRVVGATRLGGSLVRRRSGRPTPLVRAR
jgi:signal transduction histidine kinase